MIVIDFLCNGERVDGCEDWQVAMMLPIMHRLYGEVTIVEREAEAVADEPEQSFGDWLDSLMEV